MVSLKIVSNVSRLKPALNLNRVLAVLSRDLNSLNSASVRIFQDSFITRIFKGPVRIFQGPCTTRIFQGPFIVRIF